MVSKDLKYKKVSEIRCIIYGFSTCRESIEAQLNKNIKIVAYSDSFSQLKEFKGKRVYKPEQLKDIEFDIIIITIADFHNSIMVKKNLINMGIGKDKIILVWEYTKYMNIIKEAHINYKKRLNCNAQGIILGISYAQAGIRAEHLGENIYNYASGSQDIYYNLKIMQELKKQNTDKLKKLKYVIIDMYNYTYFNYDVSLSKNAIEYINNNGFESDTHNLRYNKKMSVYDLKNFKLSQSKIQILRKVFNINLMKRTSCTDYFNKNERIRIICDDEIKKISSLSYSNIQKNIFVKTENENKIYFEKLINEIYEINPNIAIILVLIPMYKAKEIKLKEIQHIWKQRFYSILQNFINKYNIHILDYKNEESISGVKEFYFDAEHLNYNGSIEFTKILKRDIKKLI